MREIKLTNSDKVVLVDDEDFDRVSKYNWWLTNLGYVITWCKVSKKRLWIQRYVLNTPDGFITDHANGNKLDNRKVNLRTCNKSQNASNSRMRSDNTSGHKGVSFDNQRNKWRATIQKNGKSILIGRYDDIEVAIRARRNGAIKFHGEFAKF